LYVYCGEVEVDFGGVVLVELGLLVVGELVEVDICEFVCLVGVYGDCD